MDEEVDCELNGVWNVKKQFTQLGSFLKVEDPNNQLAIDGDFTVLDISIHQHLILELISGYFVDGIIKPMKLWNRYK